MGLDIADAGVGLPWRRLARLGRQLATDPSTATHRSVAGEFAERTLEVTLLARLIYATEVGNYQRLAANWSKKNGPLPPAPDFPRLPGDPEPVAQPRVTVADLKAFRERTKHREAVA